MPLVPELQVFDLSQSLHFYVDLLGFQVDYTRSEHGFAAISLEDGRLMLETLASRDEATEEEFQKGQWRTGRLDYPSGRGVNFEFTIDDIQPAYLRLKEIDYPFKLDVHTKYYRVDDQQVKVRQFLIMDPDGYLVRLAQELETVKSV